jgi:hypothetical protein
MVGGDQEWPVAWDSVGTGHLEAFDELGQYFVRSVVQTSITKNRVELRHVARDLPSGRSAQAFEYGPSPAYMSESKCLDELRSVDARKCVDLRLKRCLGLQLSNYDGVICTSSKQVTESAFVHSPGRPAA